MANSPQDDAVGVVTIDIKVNGKSLSATTKVISITVTKMVNRVSTARIILLDGNMPEGEMPLSDSSDLVPGVEIEILAGYESDNKTVFKGVVVQHGVKIDGANYARLEVLCRDKAMAMTVGRKNAVFSDKTDSAVMSQLVRDYRGLTADVESTSFSHPQLVQHHATDWDFLLARAEANGFLVYAVDNKVTAKKPSSRGSSVLEVTYGSDIIAFEGDIDARTQFVSVEAVGWDETTQQATSTNASAQSLLDQGNLASRKLSSVASLDKYRLQSVSAAKSDDLDAWAKGRQLRAALARIQGSVTFAGSAKAELCTLITLKNVGDRFSGDTLITGVVHCIDHGTWTTEAHFGLDPENTARRLPITTLPKGGLAPAVNGLQVGVVVALQDDPLSDYRIKVRLPVLDADVWARLASHFHASDGFGSFFLPEINDEVLVGFLDDDPALPVVLGGLYSSKRKPAYEHEDANNTKAIRTRTGMLIELDEEKDIITVTTPAKNKLVINDEEKTMLLSDENGNTIKTSPSGIALDSPADITITAGGNVAIQATADCTIKALNVSGSADLAISATGGTTAELSASGQTTVKGAMVLIN